MTTLKSVHAILLAASAALAGCADQVSFSEDVMPILEAHCLACHQPGGAGTAASGFSVATWEDVMKGTDAGPVIDPGYSEGSTLLVLMEHRVDPSIAMPQQAGKLPAEKIRIIGDWIDQGAKNN